MSSLLGHWIIFVLLLIRNEENIKFEENLNNFGFKIITVDVAVVMQVDYATG
jgi:hypothetical protein